MHSFALFVAFTFALLSPFVSGEHQITSFKAVVPGTNSTNSTQKITFDFTFLDTQEEYPLTTQCGATWATNASAPTSTGFLCANTTVDWKFTSFQNVSSFALETEHTWREYQTGGYAVMHAYAQASFTPSNFTCTDSSSGGYVCSTPANTTLSLSIFQETSGWIPTSPPGSARRAFVA